MPIPTPEPVPVPPQPEPEPIEEPTPQVDRLTELCLAIRDYEGAPGDRNYRNNNPGNCRYYTGGYAPIYGLVKRDKSNFAIFKDYETGFLYLKNMVKNKVAKNPNQTLFQFIAVYAPSSENNPVTYANYIAKRLGVTVDTPMKLLV